MTKLQSFYSSTLGLFNGKPCVICELCITPEMVFPICLLHKCAVDRAGTCMFFQGKPLPEDEEDYDEYTYG